MSNGSEKASHSSEKLSPLETGITKEYSKYTLWGMIALYQCVLGSLKTIARWGENFSRTYCKENGVVVNVFLFSDLADSVSPGCCPYMPIITACAVFVLVLFWSSSDSAIKYERMGEIRE